MPTVYYNAAEYKSLKRRLYRRQNGQCHYCHRKMLPFGVQGNRRAATIDHVMPLSKGGADAEHNMVVACAECNEEKGDTVNGN